jgi:hypothetical protein
VALVFVGLVARLSQPRHATLRGIPFHPPDRTLRALPRQPEVQLRPVNPEALLLDHWPRPRCLQRNLRHLRGRRSWK